MVKKYKIILSVLLAVLIVVSVITVTGVFDINRIVKEKEEAANAELLSTYKETFRSSVEENSPLFRTDIKNLYYAMDKEGGVRFYEGADGLLTTVKEDGTYDITVDCSGQDLKAKIHYLEKDGKTAGYGLFTNTLYEGVYLYDYAFFKLTDMFPEFEGDKLLLADIEKTRFYTADKIYSEQFTFNGENNNEHFLSENQRIVDMYARKRADYKMFTDDILHQEQNNILFFSSRFYTAYENANKTDIITSGGDGENIDNLQYITDVASLHMWRDGDKTYYFRVIDEENFALQMFDGTAEKTIKTFEGVIGTDYLVSGKYLLNKKAGVIYSILDGAEKKLDYSDFKKGFAPDMFVISENGQYCAIRGANNRNKPAFGMADLNSGEMKTYSDDIFGFIASMNVQDDGTIILSVATGESASSYYQLVGVIGKSIPENDPNPEAIVTAAANKDEAATAAENADENENGEEAAQEDYGDYDYDYDYDYDEYEDYE